MIPKEKNIQEEVSTEVVRYHDGKEKTVQVTKRFIEKNGKKINLGVERRLLKVSKKGKDLFKVKPKKINVKRFDEKPGRELNKFEKQIKKNNELKNNELKNNE